MKNNIKKQQMATKIGSIYSPKFLNTHKVIEKTSIPPISHIEKSLKTLIKSTILLLISLPQLKSHHVYSHDDFCYSYFVSLRRTPTKPKSVKRLPKRIATVDVVSPVVGKLVVVGFVGVLAI